MIGFASINAHNDCIAGTTDPIITFLKLVNSPDTLPIALLNILDSANKAFSSIKFPIALAREPKINNNGPIAATTNPTVTIVVLTPSFNPLNQLRAPCNTLTKPFIIGNNASPIAIAAPSKADFNAVICPLRLSFIILAISSAVPELFLNSFSKSSMFPLPVCKSMFSAFSESDVKVLINAAFFCASPIPSVAFSTSRNISVMLL